MSLRAVVELLIHFESFRNIDLFHQGIYFLRACVYYQKGDKLYYAQPYTIFNAKTPNAVQGSEVLKQKTVEQGSQGVQSTIASAAPKKKKKNLDHHNIMPATLDKENFKFNTRAFMIRYCEEEVELNDMGHFRIEIDTDQNQDDKIKSALHPEDGEAGSFNQTEMVLEVELMFSDLLNHGGPEKMQSAQSLKDIEENVEYKSVALQKFMLRNVCDGIFEFIPVTFDQSHFCVAQTTVHTLLMDYRFRSSKLLAQFTKKGDVKEKMNQAELRKKERDRKKECKARNMYHGPLNITEYLFADEDGIISEKLNTSEINSIYLAYLKSLAESYERLKSKYNQFLSRCLQDKQKKENGLTGSAPNLVMPLEKDRQDQEMDLVYNNNVENTASQRSRMGGRLGTRMEGLSRTGPSSSPIPPNQMRNPQSVTEEPQIEDEEVTDRTNKISGEPEREPSKDPHYLEEKKDELSPTQYNLDESCMGDEDGQINQIMTNVQHPNYKTKFEKDIQSRQEAMRAHGNTLVPLTVRRPNTTDPYELSYQLIYDINILSTQIFSLWFKFFEVITINPKFVCEFLRIIYEEKMREYWGELIYRTVFESKDFSAPSSSQNVQEIHKSIAMKRRGLLGQDPNQLLLKSSFTDLNIIEISDQLHFTSGPAGQALSAELKKMKTKQALRNLQNLQPIIFEECFIKNMSRLREKATKAQKQLQLANQPGSKPIVPEEYNDYGVHLWVLVHGFQGNSQDMKVIKNSIALVFPEVMFLMSSANEGHTEGDIQEMGVRLAQEINSHINQFCPGNSLSKISFMSFSLGGLISRAALPYLEEHKAKMFNFITLSTPHLGCMFSKSTLVDAGIWFMKTWRKMLCMEQLKMADYDSSGNLETCFLYKLSQERGLDSFKNIILVSSHQDLYSPFDSSRIQISNKESMVQHKNGDVYIRMAQNIMNRLPVDVLYRLNVDFRIEETNLDSFIGRTAHIQFLECEQVMKMLIHRFKEIFP